MCPHCNANTEMIPITTVYWIVAVFVLATFIASWLIFHHLLYKKALYPKFCQRMDQGIISMENWFLSHWYTTLLVASSIYVFWHFNECLDLTFFQNFNGQNVIFIFWLVLLIIPLFDKFEVSGISIKTRKKVQEADASYEAAMKATNKDQILDAKALEELHKNGGQDE